MERTYAVLGSTGNCGRALVQLLLQTKNARVRAFCRDRQKLLKLVPECHNSENIEIVQGGIHDVDLITQCLRGSKVVFLCISTNDNIPGCSLAQDTAKNVIHSLKQIKAESGGLKFQAPKLVLLSSASLDSRLSMNTAWIFRVILARAASQVYEDLRVTEEILRAEEDWLSTVFIKPGGLSVDVQRGHALSLEEERSPLSYLDLAAGMIEAGDDPEGRWDMQNVGVCYTNGRASAPKGALACLAMGTLRHYFPFLHPYLPTTNIY